jgi:phosphatidate cytidylyltransferase
MLPFLFFVFWGGIAFDLVCLAMTIMMLWEFTCVFKVVGSTEIARGETEFSRAPKPAFILSTVLAIILYAIIIFVDPQFMLFWIFLVVVLSFLLTFRKRYGLSDALATIGANVYIVFFLAHAVLIDLYFTPVVSADAPGFGSAAWLRFQGFENNILWLILLTAFGSDIFAYFTGVLIGKHKLCPNLSPKKTVEGFIGGIIGSTLLCCVWGYFFLGDFFSGELDIPLPGGGNISGHFIIIGALGGAMSVLGDLTASAIKRKLGAKDYGKLIPGHGGVMDRMDSVLFTAPFLFYYVEIATVIISVAGGAVY